MKKKQKNSAASFKSCPDVRKHDLFIFQVISYTGLIAT